MTQNRFEVDKERIEEDKYAETLFIEQKGEESAPFVGEEVFVIGEQSINAYQVTKIRELPTGWRADIVFLFYANLKGLDSLESLTLDGN